MAERPLLTPLELKVMNILWDLEKAFVKDIRTHWSEDKVPAYNTISTIIRILQDKGFVDYNAYGRTYEYFPAISQQEYQESFLKDAIEHVFSGSLNSLVSAIVDGDELSEDELQELKDLIEKKDKKR